MRGSLTLQSPCSVLLRGHAAAVNHTKLYTQSSSAVIRVGFEFCSQPHTHTHTPQVKKHITHNSHFNIYLITGLSLNTASPWHTPHRVSAPHHFVVIALKAYDGGPFAVSVRAGCSVCVPQQQCVSVPLWLRLSFSQTHVRITGLLTRCSTARAAP